MSDITCWSTNKSDTFEIADYAPCGPLNSTNPRVSCCSKGDQCLSNSICHRDGSSHGASGYYTAGCTDRAYGAGCSNRCGERSSLKAAQMVKLTLNIGGVKIPEITYNPSTNLWYCCGLNTTGKPRCESPDGGTFNAPAPAKLIAYYTAPASGSATPLPGWTGSAGLSTGAEVGIGLGIAVVVPALVGFAAAVLYRQKKRKLLLQQQQKQQEPLLQKAINPSTNSNEAYVESNIAELGQQMSAVEMLSEEQLSPGLHNGAVELDGQEAPRT
jgi:hypothetical protein